jgi:ankyrin repeat protein
MITIEDKALYIDYIEYNWKELKQMPKLSIKDIFTFEEPYKMVLLFYYNYSKVYNMYNIEQLNKPFNEWEYTLYLLMVYISNIKIMSYLESRGVNIYYCNKYNNAYSIALYKSDIKIIKYLDTKGFNINNEHCHRTIFNLIWGVNNTNLLYIFKNKKYKLIKYKMGLYISFVYIIDFIYIIFILYIYMELDRYILMKDYKYYLFYDYQKLKTLKPLTKNEIELFSEPYRMYLYCWFENERSLFENERGLFENERGLFENERSLFENERSLFENERGLFEKLKAYSINDLGKQLGVNNLYFLAAYKGNIKILKFLESRGIDIYKMCSLERNAYLIAVEGGSLKTMKYLESRGFDINIKDINGDNAYLLAAYYGHLKILKYLESRGFNIYIKNKYNENDYLLGSMSGKVKILKYLESRTGDLESRSNLESRFFIKDIYYSNSFLHAIKSAKNLKMLKYLESRGFNIYSVNIYNENALFIAYMFEKDIKIIKYLSHLNRNIKTTQNLNITLITLFKNYGNGYQLKNTKFLRNINNYNKYNHKIIYIA